MLRSFSIYYCVTINSLKHNFNRNRDIIIHHGLMGNAKNFRTISKNPSISNYCNSQLIDCRNHGSSPHTETHTMQDLADDLYQLIQKRRSENINKNNWKRITLMGHSMGGIALMAFTVKYPQMQKYIERIIIIDIPCHKLGGTSQFDKTSKMLQSMLQINLDQDIKKVYSQIQNRAFSKDVAGLLKSNVKTLEQQRHQWIPNLKTIVKDIKHIGEYRLNENDWRSPIQVIYGQESHYVDERQIELYKNYYPQMRNQNFYKVQGAGNWVHFDRTKQFLQIMRSIMQKDQ